MGRELKRVPMNFNWPMDKKWKGYVNTHYKKCPDCDRGSTRSKDCLVHLVHLILVAGSDGAKGTFHPWLQACGCVPPGKDMAELSEGLAGRPMSIGLGHNCMDRFSATKKIIAVAGLSEDWGICLTCKGDAIDPTVAEAYNSWEKEDPPTGEGYQLWETTSEGSPISPVFATLDELCEYAEENCSTFGNEMTSAENWKKMLVDGFVYHQSGNMMFM